MKTLTEARSCKLQLTRWGFTYAGIGAINIFTSIWGLTLSYRFSVIIAVVNLLAGIVNLSLGYFCYTKIQEIDKLINNGERVCPE